MIFEERIVDFQELVLWKVIKFQTENSNQDAQVTRSVVDAEVGRYKNRCKMVGQRLQEIVNVSIPLKLWPDEKLHGCMDLMFLTSADLLTLPLTLVKQAHFSMQFTRCFLRYYGVRLEDKKYDQAVEALERLLKLEKKERPVYLKNSGFSRKYFDKWFHFGKGEVHRDLDPVFRYWMNNKEFGDELMRKLLERATEAA